MTLTQIQLNKILNTVVAQEWVAAINETAVKYGIDNSKERLAAFIAQICHESGGLTVLSENLNYSSAGLLRVFPRYFDATKAVAYARNPAMIANKVYGNRMGNGGEATGDGYKYRGRGAIQITGKENYAACTLALDVDFLSNPDQMSQPEYAVLSAGWYWDKNKLNRFCDSGDFVGLTKAINGGTNGLAERQSLYAKAIAVLT